MIPNKWIVTGLLAAGLLLLAGCAGGAGGGGGYDNGDTTTTTTHSGGISASVGAGGDFPGYGLMGGLAALGIAAMVARRRG